MRKIKSKEGTPWCVFCPPKTTRAVWRSQGSPMPKRACEGHRPDLHAYEHKYKDDGHMNEADHQTWGRL